MCGVQVACACPWRYICAFKAAKAGYCARAQLYAKAAEQCSRTLLGASPCHVCTRRTLACGCRSACAGVCSLIALLNNPSVPCLLLLPPCDAGYIMSQHPGGCAEGPVRMGLAARARMGRSLQRRGCSRSLCNPKVQLKHELGRCTMSMVCHDVARQITLVCLAFAQPCVMLRCWI